MRSRGRKRAAAQALARADVGWIGHPNGRKHRPRIARIRKSQRWESNPQPPHYECGALPIEATLAFFPPSLDAAISRPSAGNQVSLWPRATSVKGRWSMGLRRWRRNAIAKDQ